MRIAHCELKWEMSVTPFPRELGDAWHEEVRDMINLKDRYDAKVIGAGIGGLTCGAFLAKEGLKV